MIQTDPAEDRKMAFQRGYRRAVYDIRQLAEETALEVGGKFADTHSLNVGLNKLIRKLRFSEGEAEK